MNSVERVKEICKARKIPISALEKACGFGNGYIGQLKKGTFPDDRLYKIADFLSVDPQILLFGEDAVKKAQQNEFERRMQISTILQEKYFALDSHGKELVDLVLNAEYARCTEAQEQEEIVYIRHYLYSPAAGPGGLAEGEDYEDIPLPEGAPDGADYCLTISGDSMEPYIADGEMVYVKRDAPISDFDCGIFSVDGAIYCKQYCSSYDGSVYLLSANPKREDANVIIPKDGNSSLSYYGKVLLSKKLPKPHYQ